MTIKTTKFKLNEPLERSERGDLWRTATPRDRPWNAHAGRTQQKLEDEVIDGKDLQGVREGDLVTAIAVFTNFRLKILVVVLDVKTAIRSVVSREVDLVLAFGEANNLILAVFANEEEDVVARTANY